MKKLFLSLFALIALTSCSSSEQLIETPDCSCGHQYCGCETGCSCACNG